MRACGNILLKTVLLALTFALCAENSSACTYGPPYRTVCGTYAQADSVVVGRIRSVRGTGPRQSVVVEVKRTFKGRGQERLVLEQPQSSCDWDFKGEVGETLLLYLVRDAETKKFRAIAEGVGGKVRRRRADLYWLNGLPRSLRRTRLYGTVELYRPDPFEFVDYVAGTKVRVFNKQVSFEVATDKNGVYEIWDIPAGKYRIEPLIPPGLKLRLTLERGLVDFDSLKKPDTGAGAVLVEIGPRGCGGIDFVLNERPAPAS
jgi:hypothetical protein